MGQKLLDITPDLRLARIHKVFDDFDTYVSTDVWTTAGTGTVAAGDTAAGAATLTPTSGNNNDVYLKSTNKVFLFAANKQLAGEAYIQFSEANTSAANCFFGFASAVTTATMVDDGAGMLTNFSGCCIYKVDGGTVWKCISSLGTTQTISTSTKTAGGSAYQKLRIVVTPTSSTVAEAVFVVDDAALLDATSGKEIKHQFTYTGAVAMNVAVGMKNGSASQEVLLADYIYAAQLR